MKYGKFISIVLDQPVADDQAGIRPRQHQRQLTTLPNQAGIDHPGGDKAKWFDAALGFNSGNVGQLARQIISNEATAIKNCHS